MTEVKSKPSLLTIAGVFSRLGATAFGGPAAHIAIMEEQLVRRRKWLTHEQFLDLIGAANLVPGPNSTEVAMHAGHTQQSLPGLLVAGICFILPAAIMVAILADLYVRFGVLPATNALFYGIKPVVIAIVFQALWKLSKTALKTKWLVLLALANVALYALGVNEIALLFGTGLLSAAICSLRQSQKEPRVLATIIAGSAGLLTFAFLVQAYTPKHVGYSPAALFAYFLKLGSVLYGSGYVLLAFLRTDLVTNYHWITSAQLLDATAIGQVTPGPVFTTATFIGYILGGPLGAVLATVGIFLPAFVLVAISGPLVQRIRGSAVAGAFLDAVNAAALALMAVVLFQLAQAAFVDWITVVIAVGCGLLLLRTRINSVWLIALGAACGLIVKH